MSYKLTVYHSGDEWGSNPNSCLIYVLPKKAPKDFRIEFSTYATTGIFFGFGGIDFCDLSASQHGSNRIRLNHPYIHQEALTMRSCVQVGLIFQNELHGQSCIHPFITKQGTGHIASKLRQCQVENHLWLTQLGNKNILFSPESVDSNDVKGSFTKDTGTQNTCKILAKRVQ